MRKRVCNTSVTFLCSFLHTGICNMQRAQASVNSPLCKPWQPESATVLLNTCKCARDLPARWHISKRSTTPCHKFSIATNWYKFYIAERLVATVVNVFPWPCIVYCHLESVFCFCGHTPGDASLHNVRRASLYRHSINPFSIVIHTV